MTLPSIRDTLAPDLFTKPNLNADIRIGAAGPQERELLITMYDQFDPLGAALGLPPYGPEVRSDWIGRALNHDMNLAAFSPAGEIIGHCFLGEETQCSAELAIFVHQDFRRRGLGTALVKAALQWACNAGLGRVWTMTSSDNRAVFRLLQRCGFRLRTSLSREVELEIDLAGLLRASGKVALPVRS
jgi:RimJ/RimL family protein N-acetyltransferase